MTSVSDALRGSGLTSLGWSSMNSVSSALRGSGPALQGFIPTTSVDALYAEFSRWMGVEPLDYPNLLPNYAKFVGHSKGLGLENLMMG